MPLHFCKWNLFLNVLNAIALFIVRGDEPNNDRQFVTVQDMTLQDHVISSHDVTSPIDCSFLCTSNDKCKTYNYKPRGAGDKDVCQLNKATRKTNPRSYKPDVGFVHYFDQSENFKSCLDYLRNGAKENGIYTITDSGGDSYPVFCDLNSEPRSAWTLILSFAFKNRNMYEFSTKTLYTSSPLEENNPNWETYRLSFGRMQQLSELSTHVRFTTGFQKFGIDFHDYLRAKITDLDILKFSAIRQCKNVEYVNVRGNVGEDVTVPLYRNVFVYVDSSSSSCQFDARGGSVSGERNFGSYILFINPKFRGSKDEESTTEFWFGGYLE